MRILFVHEVNYLTKPIFEMHEFPEYLAERGHEVFFLQFPEGASAGEIRNLGWSIEIAGRAVARSTITLLTPAILGSGIFSRLVAAALGQRIVKRAIETSKPDVIVTLAVPTFGWQAVKVARKLGIPIIYRALDVSHRIRGGLFSPLVKSAETFVAKNASAVSANNPAMADYIERIGNRDKDVHTHLPPMDLERYRAGDRLRGRELIGLGPDEFAILYMGSFFYFSGLPEAIRGFAAAPDTRSTKLVFVGGGDQEKELRSLVSELNLDDKVIFTGFVSFEELANYLAAADVLINPMHKGLVSNTALPNKVIQYLATGIPVVSTELSGLRATLGSFEDLVFTQSPEECLQEALKFSQTSMTPNAERNLPQLRQLFGEGAIDKFEAFLERAGSSS